MRTRTIFEAYENARELRQVRHNTGDYYFSAARDDRAARQVDVFIVELLRRMDERDAMAAKAKAWDALQKWKALDEAGFCSYYDLNKAKDAADAAASEVA